MLKVNNRYSELCFEDSQYFTIFQPSFKPVLNTQILHTLQLQVSLKTPNFLFWRCYAQEHLAAFPHAHTKNKYWNTKMKRIQNFKGWLSGQN